MEKFRKPTGQGLSVAVYDALRDALRNGEYKPGERLLEEEVAQRFAVSRTPVREAFGRLQARGLVETGGRRGLVVRRLDVRDVMELYTMREIIEGAAAGLAAEHASSTEVEALRDLNADFAAGSGDAQVMARVNRVFHEAIYRAARNRYLDLGLLEIQDAIGLLGATTFSVAERPAVAVEEHAGIIDAIARRDRPEAEERARSHIRGALRARLRLMHEA